MQDISIGRGCALFNVHENLIEKIGNSIPKERLKDIIYLIYQAENVYKSTIHIACGKLALGALKN
ncbi:hypothetical protein ACO1K8_14565, partial [Staphylococcus aureus]